MTISDRHYSFDTSALIDGLERFYPLANFPALWEKIDKLIDAGRFHISEEVWNEALSADALLKDWCTDVDGARDRAITPTDALIASTAGSIVAQYPRWGQQGHKNTADPFVIAVAECHGHVVISGEKDGGPSKPKIPYVCGQRGVEHGRFVDVVRREGWVFG